MTAIKVADAIAFSDVVVGYRDAIEAWTQTLLQPYLVWLRGAGKGRRVAKQFNDPVWGTIVLEPHEVVVLDSPLLQRLRRIRQLGVVHLVYPGANHTRFEHSLGVAHQVSQLAQSLNRSDDDGPPVIDPETVDILRLAGLLHDVGHGLMSHVVENALAGEYDSEQLLLDFKKGLRRSSKVQLSEMAAYFMISSPAVCELVELAYAATTKQAPQNATSTIARIVAGKNVSDELPVLHELISGPFDADKLDYMPRDARMCGVPVVTDVVRLVQKARTATVRSDRLPASMTAVRKLEGGHKVFGIARSGASALDEVSLNRSLMFDKVYRHHKVRAVEAMVGAALEILHPVWGPMSAMMPLMVMDDQFVELTQVDLESLNVAQGNPVPDDNMKIATDIMQKIRDRHLFDRAFAFAVTMPGDAYRDDGPHEAASEDFVREIDTDIIKRRAFVAAIVERVGQIAALTGEREEIDRIGLAYLHHYIRVDPPASSGRGSQSDQSRAFLIDESGSLLPVEKERSENRAWADAYVNTKDVGFIFAPREISNLVHIAAEVAARTEYQVRVPLQMHSYAKKVGPELRDLRRRLQDKGFYKDLPRDLEPLPDLFSTAEAEQRVAATLKNLRGYMGPTHRQESPGSTGSTLNETKIVRWAAQFPAAHQGNALRVAENIKMLTREDANQTLQEFSRANLEFSGAALVPIGEPKDGSSIVAYHLRDSELETGYEVTNLVLALRDKRPIVFVDDFVGMGRSSAGIFTSYMGGDGGADLGEKRKVVLDAVEQSTLREVPVALVWVAGFEDGAKHTVETLRGFGVEAKHFIHTPAERLPTVGKALSDVTPADVEEFLDLCKSVGRQLLEPTTEPKKLEERLLGYGNFGMLITYSYNTPSVTLTALAHDGEVDGREWAALIPRRKKL